MAQYSWFVLPVPLLYFQMSFQILPTSAMALWDKKEQWLAKRQVPGCLDENLRNSLRNVSWKKSQNQAAKFCTGILQINLKYSVILHY